MVSSQSTSCYFSPLQALLIFSTNYNIFHSILGLENVLISISFRHWNVLWFSCPVQTGPQQSVTERVYQSYNRTTRYTMRFYWVSLFSTYVSSTYFGPHRSIIRRVLYKLYLQIWYVVLLCVLLDTSSRYGWTCRVVRVLPHTKVCDYNVYKTLLVMDRWGPKHVELT